MPETLFPEEITEPHFEAPVEEPMKPAESRWEANEAEIFDRLGKKVSEVLRIKEVADNAVLAENDQVVTMMMESEIDALERKTTPEIRKKVSRLDNVRIELQLLEAEIRPFESITDPVPESTPESAARYAELIELWDQKSAERNELRNDEDLVFELNMRSVLFDLQFKHALLPRLKERKNLSGYLKNVVGLKNLDESKMKEVQWGPFDVSITLSSDHFDQVTESPGAVGIHYVGRPINLIRDGARNPEQVIEHERVHNILDATVIQFRDPSGHAVRSIRNAFQEVDDPALAMSEDQKNRLVEQETPTLLNYLHEELLAELEEAERIDFGLDLAEKHGLDKAVMTETERFVYYTGALATAGQAAKDTTRSLHRLFKEATAEDIISGASGLYLNFRHRFISMVDTMRNNLQRGKNIGPKTHTEVHALLYILPPSKYRHIKRYLDHKYGPDSGLEKQPQGAPEQGLANG